MELLETQPTYGKLAEAIAKAQAEMSNPKFDKVNPHFKNKFASLAAVRDAVVPVLAKHGVSCLQDVQNVPGGVSCTTMLIHSSGEMLKLGPLTMPASKGDAQGFGSAATYARRYHLMAVANVVGDEDDDANEAANVGNWNHTPADDLGKKVPTKVVNQWAKALMAAQDEQDKLWSIWAELKSDHDTTIAVWATLPKAMKDRINDAKAAKEPQAA